MDRLPCWEQIKGDGFAFEKVIEKLLKVMFPLEKYVHTHETRDGGKDFVCITRNDEEYWAECKNYSDNLATSDIAKTFVMAIAEDVKQVMVFSISPFTDIAIQEITRFTQKIKYEVKLYDGDALNCLMYQHIESIDMPEDFKNSFRLNKHGKEFLYFSTVSRNNYERECLTKDFCIGDLVNYQIYFKNNTQEEISVSYHFNPKDIPEQLLLIEDDSNAQKGVITIEPGSYVQRCFLFRIINYLSRIRLFDLYCTVNGQNFSLEGKTICCKWIAEVALLGQGRESLQELQKKYVGSKQANLFSVYGHSGVGKSRLMHEIKNSYENIRHQVLFLKAGDTCKSGEILVRKMLAMVKGLPYLAEENIQVNSKKLVYQALYNSQFNISENIDKLFEIIYESLQGDKRIAVIIDDLQFADKLLIQTIRYILHSGQNKIILITGFNMDYLVKGTDHWNLFQQIQSIADTDGNKKIELTNFDSPTAEEYIYNCLDKQLLYQNRLRDTINLMIQNCGTNPLILHQTLLLMEQMRILEKVGDSFYISDIRRFRQVIKSLTPDLEKTLKRRHELLSSSFSDDLYRQYIMFVVILSVCRQLSPEVVQSLLQNNLDVLEQLNTLGIVKYNDDGDVIFYHQKLEIFYFKLCIDSSSNKDILIACQHLPDASFVEKFIIANKVDEVSESEFRQGLACMDFVDYSNEYRFIKALFAQKEKFSIDVESYLSLLEHYYRIIQNHKGIHYKIEEYICVIKKIMDDAETNKDYGILVWRIILTGVNSLIQLSKMDESLDILNKFESTVAVYSCSRIEQMNILSSLYNRYSTVYAALSNLDRAKYYLKKSLKLGLKTHDKYKIIEAYTEYGSLYYDVKGKIRITYKYWNKAFRFYQRTKPVAYEYLAPKCYYHKIMIYLLKHNYAKAEKLLNKYKTTFWNQTEGYYKLKLLFVNIVLEMLKEKKYSAVDHMEIEILLNCAEDKCVCDGRVREYYKVFYLKALYFFYFQGQKDIAYENFQIAYKQIVDFCDTATLKRLTPVMLELEKYINNLQNDYSNSRHQMLTQEFMEKNAQWVRHLQKESTIFYIMPLTDKEHNIKFPRL